MMKIKVCGMKFPENIQKVAGLDIDYMGFIFYPKSPRYMGESNLDLSDLLPAGLKKMGVFVNEDLESILKNVYKYKLDGVQLHGAELETMCAELKSVGLIVFKAFSLDSEFNFSVCKKYEGTCDYFVFDTKTEAYGGSGRKFDWTKLNEYKGQTKFLLSGGISENDAEDISTIDHPMFAGVDLNSKFELSPGLKNAYSLKVFIDKLKLIN